MALLIPVGESVSRGEREMLHYLKNKLPEDWYIVGNPTITDGVKDFELDAIVIGNDYVWAIEEKGFWGEITGDRNTWILPDGTKKPQVINLIGQKARVAKTEITNSGMLKSHKIYVGSIVLLSSNNIIMNVNDPRITSTDNRRVYPLIGCEDYFLNHNLSGRKPICPDDRESILRIFVGDVMVDHYFSMLNTPTSKNKGQHTKSASKDKDSERMIIRLAGEGEFQRIYYEDKTIDRNELRGAYPKDIVQYLHGTGIRLHFGNGVIQVAVLNYNIPQVLLSSRILKPGDMVSLYEGSKTIQIEKLKLQITVYPLSEENA